jgi:hypothetical protein
MKAKSKSATKSLTIRAASDLELADALEAAARKIRAKVKGGNWRLTEMMQKRGLKDRDIAIEVGSTLQAVYYWRRAMRSPGKANLGLITQLMKCKPADIGLDDNGNALP